MKETYIQVVRKIGEILERQIFLINLRVEAALSIQQVPLNDYSDMQVLVQWDLFSEAMEVLAAFSPSTPIKTVERAVTLF